MRIVATHKRRMIPMTATPTIITDELEERPPLPVVGEADNVIVEFSINDTIMCRKVLHTYP